MPKPRGRTAIAWLVAFGAACGGNKTDTPTDANVPSLQVVVHGLGRVTSDPAGIDCPGECEATFPVGVEVALAHTQRPPWAFDGWSGACEGGGGCAVTIGEPAQVNADFAPSRQWEWALQLSPTHTFASPYATATVVTMDDAGTIAVSGQLFGRMDLGNGVVIEDLDLQCTWLAVLEADGTARWGRCFARTNGWMEPSSLAVLDNGDVAAAGRFAGQVEVGGATISSAGVEDVFIGRWSGADGSLVWIQQAGGTASSSGWVGEVVQGHPGGDLFLSGGFYGTLQLGSATFTSSPDGDALVARLALADGAPVWVVPIVTPGVGTGVSALAVDPDGDVAVGGATGQFVTSDYDILLARLAGGDGALIWRKDLEGPGTGWDFAAGARIDSSGAYVFAGFMTGAIDFGGGLVEPLYDGASLPGPCNLFVAHYAPEGTFLSAQRIGGPSAMNYSLPISFDVGGDDGVVLGGGFTYTMSLGPAGGPATIESNWLPEAGYSEPDGFVAWFEADGNPLLWDAFGSFARDTVYRLAANPTGEVVLVGSSLGPVSLGAIDLDSLEETAFIAKQQYGDPP